MSDDPDIVRLVADDNHGKRVFELVNAGLTALNPSSEDACVLASYVKVCTCCHIEPGYHVVTSLKMALVKDYLTRNMTRLHDQLKAGETPTTDMYWIKATWARKHSRALLILSKELGEHLEAMHRDYVEEKPVNTTLRVQCRDGAFYACLSIAAAVFQGERKVEAEAEAMFREAKATGDYSKITAKLGC